MRGIRTACMVSAIAIAGWVGNASAAVEENFASHPPMRPLPVATKVPLEKGPAVFVDVNKGADTNDGTEQSPFKSISRGLKQLKPGDTLVIRGGTYYEHLKLMRSGTAEAPITIRNYPGELPIVDGGLREFYDSPETSWEPAKDGAAGEYVSTKAYPDVDQRVVPYNFITAAWEPMAGKEDRRPLALGHFADSMVPLHSYRVLEDLQATNESHINNKPVAKGEKKAEPEEIGMYCGPGLWYNRETGKVHARLAHTELKGLKENAYRGETDPRKLKLIVALGFGQEVVRITGIQHVNLQGLALRGATGSPMIHIYGSQNIQLDHLTSYGGNPALLLNASQDIKVTNTAFRGLSAPWSSRASEKYRGTAAYSLLLQNNQPENDKIEIAYCEFTDEHDFSQVRYVKTIHFHHNFVENYNDDGMEVGPKIRDHKIYIYQNRMSRVQIPISQHESRKDESPIDHDPGTGVFMYRNVLDLRGGTYKTPPKDPDEDGAYMHEEAHVFGDHGSPIWPNIRFYQNTVLRKSQVFRNHYLMGTATQGARFNERDVYNNIYWQEQELGQVVIPAMKQVETVREGGNVVWSLKGSNDPDKFFAKFRASPLFEQSKQKYPNGWTTDDKIADPKFNNLPEDWRQPTDLRIASQGGAAEAGVTVPAEFPDPLREKDSGKPDAGALPAGVEPWGVGVDGRISVFGEMMK